MWYVSAHPDVTHRAEEVVVIAENQTFTEKRLQLDGASFYKCKFERCTFVYSGLMACVLSENSFDDCRWEFDGPASNALKLMNSLYRQGTGGQKIIDALINEIRSAGPRK